MKALGIALTLPAVLAGCGPSSSVVAPAGAVCAFVVQRDAQQGIWLGLAELEGCSRVVFYIEGDR